jgi:hypothetical protein
MQIKIHQKAQTRSRIRIKLQRIHKARIRMEDRDRYLKGSTSLSCLKYSTAWSTCRMLWNAMAIWAITYVESCIRTLYRKNLLVVIIAVFWISFGFNADPNQVF